jgi:diadenosine tetraphosphate (Ap4A) HIT family hydrolase
MSYDDGNVFARILRGEIPSAKVFENEHALAFRDISPKRPVHVLVIPKGPYATWHDLAERGSDAEIAGFVRAVAAVARSEKVDASGYRLICNNGEHGHQEVPHVHVHVIGGAPAGPMLKGS